MIIQSDSHNAYAINHMEMERILASVGFEDGDFSTLDEAHLW